jgi:hypothetical protein
MLYTNKKLFSKKQLFLNYKNYFNFKKLKKSFLFVYNMVLIN